MRMVFLMAVLQRYNSVQQVGQNVGSAGVLMLARYSVSQCHHIGQIATAIGWPSVRLLLAGPASSSSLIATVGLPGLLGSTVAPRLLEEYLLIKL